MKRLLVILVAGLVLNAVQWHRRSTAIAYHATAPRVKTDPAALVPARPVELTAVEREHAENLASRFLNLPSSRTGDQVHEPTRILAEAEKMPDAAYLQFARSVIAGPGDTDAKTVFIRTAERNAVMAFDWALTEAALHTGEVMTTHQVLAWWTVTDPAGARRWMLSTLQRGGLSEPAAAWLQGARRNFAAALAGSIPEEAAAILLEKPPSNVWIPQARDILALSLPTPAQRNAFLAALNGVSAGREPWTSDYSLMMAALGTIGRNGGSLQEFLTACASLPGPHDQLAGKVEGSFRHFGQEPEYIAWAEQHFNKSPWIGGFMASWVLRDTEAATAWLASRSPGPLRDAAIEGMMQPLKQFEPEAALAWALQVTDTTKHTWLCRNIFDEWSQSAPEQAAAAFRAKGIPVPPP